MLAHLRISVLMLVAMTLLTGVAYPLVVTWIGQAAFHHQANGSLIMQDGKPVGSELIGQPFDDPKYFWPRPSATHNTAGTAPLPYNAASSSGSNLAVTNPAQLAAIQRRIAKLRAADPGNAAPVPIDLVTASGSGLDPDISVAAAEYQVPRVARTRGLSVDAVRELVRRSTAGRQFGVLGVPRVNVLRLNLALDQLHG